MSLDPASLQILISRLDGIADEMGAVLRRAAYSPNIKERADCSAAVFTADGELLAQAEHIPVHLGSMPASVAAVIDAVAATRCGSRPATSSSLNDPFAGGTHLNDITVVAPCFVGLGSSAGSRTGRTTPTSAASTPGSMPPDATEIARGGPADPARRGSTTTWRSVIAVGVAHAGRAAEAISTRSAARTGSVSIG